MGDCTVAIDPTVQAQLDAAAARGIAASGAFFEQHAMMIAQHAENDGRLMGGFLAGQLFNAQLVQAKSAFHTPVEPQAAPLPSSPQTPK